MEQHGRSQLQLKLNCSNLKGVIIMSKTKYLVCYESRCDFLEKGAKHYRNLCRVTRTQIVSSSVIEPTEKAIRAFENAHFGKTEGEEGTYIGSCKVLAITRLYGEWC